MIGVDRRKNKDNEVYQNLKMGNIPSDILKVPVRVKQLLGIKCEQFSAMYDRSKYLFMLDAPFEVSSKCCKVMKKAPIHRYNKLYDQVSITAQMASESKLRTTQWLKNGCNGFDMKSPISNPMSFWTEQDVLLYIYLNKDSMVNQKINSNSKVMKYADRIVSRKTGADVDNIEYYNAICSVYGDVVIDYESEGNPDGQMDLSDLSADMGIFDYGIRPLKTTGCERTGCMLCGFGCHLEKSPNRFEMLKETHPQMYKLLDVVKNNGVTMREAIDWINSNSDLNIKY